MRLQYEIGATNRGQLRTVLRSVEREIQASNRRMIAQTQQANRTSARASGSAAAALMLGPGRKEAAKAEAFRHRQSLANIKTEERARTAAARSSARAAESLDRQRSRALIAQHRDHERSRLQAERAADRAATRRGGTPAKMARGFARGVHGVVGGAARIVGTGAAIAGGFAAAEAIREDSAIRRSASQLANQAGTPELKGKLAQESRGVRGFTGEEVLGGMSEFVTKTGDLDTARAIIGDLGQLSLATGANLGDLGATAGQAFNVLKDQIADPVERVKQLNALMGVLAQQGAMGAVEIRDLAQDFGKLGAATRGFEGTAPDLLRTMGAFAQVAVARGGAESSADASTAASRLVNDMVMHKKKFSGLGINIKSEKDPTKLRNPMEIMADVLEKTGGDVEKTSGLFGLESGKIFKGFAATYSEAEKKQKGSGRGAVMAEFQRYSGAELAPEEIKKRAESRMEDPDMQFSEAAKSFNEAVSKELMPAITKLIPPFVALTPAIGGVLEAFAKLLRLLPGQGVAPVVPKEGEPGYVPPADETRQQRRFREVASGKSGFLDTMADTVMGPAEHISAMWKHGTLNPFNDAVSAELSGKKPMQAPGMAPGGTPAAPLVAPAAAQSAPADGTAKKFDAVVDKFSGAVDRLNKSGPGEASRNAPIVSPSRG